MSDDARTAQRWDPGARYRPSALAAGRGSIDAEGPVRLAGRLRRGPAARTAVFDRPVWRADVGHAGATSAIRAVLTAYRRGAVDTSGMLRAVGHVLG